MPSVHVAPSTACSRCPIAATFAPMIPEGAGSSGSSSLLTAAPVRG